MHERAAEVIRVAAQDRQSVSRVAPTAGGMHGRRARYLLQRFLRLIPAGADQTGRVGGRPACGPASAPAWCHCGRVGAAAIMHLLLSMRRAAGVEVLTGTAAHAQGRYRAAFISARPMISFWTSVAPS